MTRRYDLTGKRFGRLVALHPDKNEKGRRVWKCQCDCGNVSYPLTSNLVLGGTNSCGCLFKEKLLKRITSHGKANTKIYKLWTYMISRCHNPNDTCYDRYGGRGISVCDEWHDFEQFYADMGNCPDGMSIDRIDNDGNYEPDNCRWATIIQQANNKSSNAMIEFNGERMSMMDWSRKLGISYPALRHRRQRGWSVERMLTTPVKKQ